MVAQCGLGVINANRKTKFRNKHHLKEINRANGRIFSPVLSQILPPS